jgi:hypothetical protein
MQPMMQSKTTVITNLSQQLGSRITWYVKMQPTKLQALTWQKLMLTTFMQATVTHPTAQQS